MNVLRCELEGVVILEPKVFGDGRGFFLEIWHQQRHCDAGLPVEFVQDNVSFSRKGTLRGLHFQNPHTQGKLLQVLDGEIFDVAVDLRMSSATFGRWHGFVLSGENKRQFYVPPGFAHGFAVTSDTALVHYKCTDFYSPADEVTLLWNDPDVGVRWPIAEPILSEKDRRGVRLAELPKEKLFV